MDAVQRMRAMAYDRKKLVTTKELVVTARQEQSRQVIVIEPAVPDTVYVPYYEPQVVYGDWPYSDYPAYPYYWGYPGYIAAGVIATGLAFGGAYALGRWASGRYWGGGGYWGGSRINWAGGAINVNRGAHVEHWRHNPAHRQRRALQQCGPAAEIRWRQSRRRRHPCRRRRRCWRWRRRCRPERAGGRCPGGQRRRSRPTDRRARRKRARWQSPGRPAGGCRKECGSGQPRSFQSRKFQVRCRRASWRRGAVRGRRRTPCCSIPGRRGLPWWWWRGARWWASLGYHAET